MVRNPGGAGSVLLLSPWLSLGLPNRKETPLLSPHGFRALSACGGPLRAISVASCRGSCPYPRSRVNKMIMKCWIKELIADSFQALLCYQQCCSQSCCSCISS